MRENRELLKVYFTLINHYKKKNKNIVFGTI